MMAVAGKYRDMGTMVEGKIEVKHPLNFYFLLFSLLESEAYSNIHFLPSTIPAQLSSLLHGRILRDNY